MLKPAPYFWNYNNIENPLNGFALFCANPRNDPRIPTCRVKLGIVAERFERIVARIKTDRDHAYILARLHEVVMEISKITASDLTYRWTGCVNKLNQDKFI